MDVRSEFIMIVGYEALVKFFPGGGVCFECRGAIRGYARQSKSRKGGREVHEAGDDALPAFHAAGLRQGQKDEVAADDFSAWRRRTWNESRESCGAWSGKNCHESRGFSVRGDFAAMPERRGLGEGS